MSVKETPIRGGNYLVAYDNGLKAIVTDKSRSNDFKTQAMNEYFNSSVSGAEAIAMDCWAPILQNENGQYELDPTKGYWSEEATLLRAISDAHTSAGAYSGDPVHNQARMRSIVASAGSPEAIRDYYHKMATVQEQITMQDYLAGEYRGAVDIVMNAFLNELERDRQGRMNSPAVQAAERALETLKRDGAAAYTVTMNLVDTFGRGSWYLNTLPSLIRFDRQYKTVGAEVGNTQLVEVVEFTRQSWGVVMHDNIRFTVDTMLTVTNGRRVF